MILLLEIETDANIYPHICAFSHVIDPIMYSAKLLVRINLENMFYLSIYTIYFRITAVFGWHCIADFV